jgi:excisionase family DNA binding protein
MMADVSEELRTAPNSSGTGVVRVEDAARELGIGRTMTFGLIKSGALRSLKIGSRRLVPMSAIAEFIEEQSRCTDDLNRLPIEGALGHEKPRHEYRPPTSERRRIAEPKTS